MKNPRTLVCLAGALLLLPVSSPAATAEGSPAAGGGAPQKTRTLFMGTDISIELGSKLYRISDVNGDAFVVTVNGKETLVPMRGQPNSLKVVPTLKLTDTSASVTGFSCERAYTPGNDPRMRHMVEANDAMTAIQDSASLAEGKYSLAMNNFGFPAPPIHIGPGKPSPEEILTNNANTLAYDQSYAKVYQASIDMATAMYDSDITEGGYGQIRAAEELVHEPYDAVEVNFTVSSPVPLEKPYLFLIVNYRESASRKDSMRKLIYAKALAPIGAKAERIHCMQGGLPPGFVMESYQLHIYDSGREIASDVAPKRVALTLEDAFQYVMIDYLSRHKGATLPAAPAIGKPDQAVAASLTRSELSGAYYVKVSKDGMPLEAYSDMLCTTPVDKGVGSVVKNVRFYPALVDGKPVEGVARLVLTQLAI